MRKVVILLIISMVCFNAFAADQKYKIELVIFSQNMPNTEVFDQTESSIAWPRRLHKPSSYENVEPEFRQLKGDYVKLLRSNNYQPLMHIAWFQRVKKNKLGTAIKISNPEGTINGFFQIQRGNLVYMIVDIEYSIDSIVYRLKEKRRFKLNEMHYLDHPKFGILAVISPIKE